MRRRCRFVDGPLDGIDRVEEVGPGGVVPVPIFRPVRMVQADDSPVARAIETGIYRVDDRTLRSSCLPTVLVWQGTRQYAVVWADAPSQAVSPVYETKREAYTWLYDHLAGERFVRPASFSVSWVPQP